MGLGLWQGGARRGEWVALSLNRRVLFSRTLALAGLVLLTGCTWRTKNADHFFGPAFFRYAQSEGQDALLYETRHFPLVFEGGGQWGFCLGLAQRFTISSENSAAANHTPRLRATLVSPEQGRWHLSLVRLRVAQNDSPVFLRRSAAGLHAGLGQEENAVTLGYSAITLTRPIHEGIYQLEFKSKRPLDSSLTFHPHENQMID